MKRREQASSDVDLSTLCRKVKLTGADGKTYASEAVNTESAFRIIQSIPSPKAEPFKRWLAEVGYRRVQEIENPELAQHRMRELFRQKGYPDDWIEKSRATPVANLKPSRGVESPHPTTTSPTNQKQDCRPSRSNRNYGNEV